MAVTQEGAKAYKKRIFAGRILSVIPAGKWFDWVDNVANYKKHTGVVGIPTGRKHFFGEVLLETVFLPTCVGVFEKTQVYLPANCDAYLTNLYGDYMEIPPVEKRERHLIVDFRIHE